MLLEIKRGIFLGRLIARAKNYGELHPEKYLAAIEGKTQNDIARYIEEEALKYPEVNWLYVNPDYLPIRADEITQENLRNKWLLRMFIRFGPKTLVDSFIEGMTKSNRDLWMNWIYGEAQCKEINGEDIVLLNLQVISQVWDLSDFNRTANLKQVVQEIVKHEFRHAEQIKSLRAAGGPELVKKAIGMKRKMEYGTDPMEWDAFMYQIGKGQPIEEFVKEVKEA